MNVLDYGKSFVTFVTEGRGNNARLQIESVCRLTDMTSENTTDYYFFASCKSEDTFANRDLFYADNYDFCGVFSDREYILFRTHATHTDGFREEGLWRDRNSVFPWNSIWFPVRPWKKPIRERSLS